MTRLRPGKARVLLIGACDEADTILIGMLSARDRDSAMKLAAMVHDHAVNGHFDVLFAAPAPFEVSVTSTSDDGTELPLAISDDGTELTT